MGSPPAPAWTGLGPALAGAREGARLVLWGRIEAGMLVDATGAAILEPAQGVPPLPEGAVGRVEGTWREGLLQVQACTLRPGRGRAHLGEVGGRVPELSARFALVERLRQALRARGYREVDTALVLEATGTDPFIEPIPVRLAPTWNPAAPQGPAALHTSPELELKRLLALGFPALFQVGHVFRQGDLSPWHEPEFCMAEWYRVGWAMDALVDELAQLVVELLGGPPPRRLRVADLCRELAGVEILDLQEGVALSERLGGPPEPFVHAFSRLWLERVEPSLASRGAVLVTHWPATLGMLARRDEQDPRVALRFELVVNGVELANGFEELTDPVEQRARFEADLDRRAAEGLPPAPMPERFLAALEAGLPPCSGLALGVDRLVMLALGLPCLSEALASPAAARWPGRGSATAPG